MKSLRLFLNLWMIMVITLLAVLPGSNVLAVANNQTALTPTEKAQALLESLTPAEKVGQLFLVTFDSRDVGEFSEIYELIVRYHVGGVVLKAENDNFTGPENTVQNTYEMIHALQLHEWEGAANVGATAAEEEIPQYIPLFIGISQEGDGVPYDQIISGMTPLPSPMAIGATWDSDLSYQIGEIMGSELAAMGFNLYLGPSLDVLEVLPTSTSDDLGVRSFGGDPYWVGKMGQSYIEGLHTGSDNRLAVISKHFPGRGGSDRAPTEEVATVRKSLEQLKQIELAPFFTVTNITQPPEKQTDGLLVSHIRYQGFQGNIRSTTRPVSFDQTTLEQLMALSQFTGWRDSGGIIVSDDLGSQAVRRFFDPTNLGFDARQVARNAFLAGNDLLYMDNFIATGDENQFTTLTRTLAFFVTKYNEDPAFAEKVDQSVQRLLTLKYKLYPDFNMETVLPLESNLSTVGQSQSKSFEVAQKAVTLISPDPDALGVILPGAPEMRERIIFITDTLYSRQCSTCLEEPIVAADTLQSTILRLYGPQTGGQVVSGRLSSYSFNNLLNFLDDIEDNQSLESDLVAANWVVFSFLNITEKRESSFALERLLSERPELLRDKRVIAFAFNAPYYLDATDISKLTAYYGLYSKGPPFFEVAARILFDELVPDGASPVSIHGIGYDLINATSPDPNQVIPLHYEAITGSPLPTPTETTATAVSATNPSAYEVGNIISLKTGTILDHNGHPVPDGTVVRFRFVNFKGGETTTQQIETTTVDGQARTDFRVQNSGFLEVTVNSEPALQSDLLQFEITGEELSAITIVVPIMTSEVTDTPEPTTQPTASSTPTNQPTPTPTPTPLPEVITEPGISDWMLSTGLTWIIAVGIFWIGQRKGSIRWRVRRGLLVVIGGLLGYGYLAIGLPGTESMFESTGQAAALLMSLTGAILGILAGFLWHFQAGPSR